MEEESKNEEHPTSQATVIWPVLPHHRRRPHRPRRNAVVFERPPLINFDDEESKHND